jgi:hypothetical protein
VADSATAHRLGSTVGFVPDGSLDRPFLSLEAARDALRSSSSGVPRNIHLRAGHHALTRRFKLDERDAGTVESPITYATHPDDLGRGLRARISGGIAVPPSAFRAAPDERVGLLRQRGAPSSRFTLTISARLT